MITQVWQIDFEGDDQNKIANSKKHTTSSIDLGRGDHWNSFMIETEKHSVSNPSLKDIRDSKGRATEVDIQIDGSVAAYNTGWGYKNQVYAPSKSYVPDNPVSLLGDHIWFAQGRGTSDEIGIVFSDLTPGVYRYTSFVNYTDHNPQRTYDMTVNGKTVRLAGQEVSAGSKETVDVDANAAVITNIRVGADGTLSVRYVGVPQADGRQDPSIAGVRLDLLSEPAGVRGVSAAQLKKASAPTPKSEAKLDPPDKTDAAPKPTESEAVQTSTARFDKMSGRDGKADTFEFGQLNKPGLRADKIINFEADEGDRVDISSIPEFFDPRSDDIADFVQLKHTHSGTRIEINVNGDLDGQDYKRAIVLYGVNDLKLENMVENQSLIVSYQKTSGPGPKTSKPDAPASYPGANYLFSTKQFDKLVGTDGEVDIFSFEEPNSSTARVDKVARFSASDGDKIDVAQLLIGYDAGLDNPSDFVRLRHIHSGTRVEIDRNGSAGGRDYDYEFVLSGVYELDLSELIHSGTLIV